MIYETIRLVGEPGLSALRGSFAFLLAGRHSSPTFSVMKPIHLTTGAKEARWFVRFLAGLALFATVAALSEWITPSAPPFKGRLAWVIEGVFALVGTAGLVGLWLLVAVALAVTARFVWRHTARLPGDRWLG